MGSKSLIFINCHLRGKVFFFFNIIVHLETKLSLLAHQTHVAERNANIQRILYELKMPRFKTQKKKKKNIGKGLNHTVSLFNL